MSPGSRDHVTGAQWVGQANKDGLESEHLPRQHFTTAPGTVPPLTRLVRPPTQLPRTQNDSQIPVHCSVLPTAACSSARCDERAMAETTREENIRGRAVTVKMSAGSKDRLLRTCWTVLCILVPLHFFSGSSGAPGGHPGGASGDDFDLFTKLFRTYKKALRPVSSPNDSMMVEVGVALTHIINMDEKHQTLTANLWLTMGWNDTNLTWNATDYNNLWYFTVPADMVWKPDIVLYQNDNRTNPYKLQKGHLDREVRKSVHRESVFLSFQSAGRLKGLHVDPESWHTGVIGQAESGINTTHARSHQCHDLPRETSETPWFTSVHRPLLNLLYHYTLRKVPKLPRPYEFMDPNETKVTYRSSEVHHDSRRVATKVWFNKTGCVDPYFDGWSRGEMYVKVHQNGYILWEIPSVTSSSCDIDVSSFPFDIQKCELAFGPWIHSGYEVDMKSMAGNGSLEGFIDHAEWDILSFVAERHMGTYGEDFNIGTPYADVTFTLELRRKSTFYVFNLLLPCLLLTSIMSATFFLPIDSGEKLSFGVSLLLSMVVFQLVLNEVLPESDKLPWIGEKHFPTAIAYVLVSGE
ncbi:acetylcholine-gated cation-selective channel [Branchiostoma belcheri]|nr:acetylcholine-gated cation-selective channel [Branchiostoma belcheri]